MQISKEKKIEIFHTMLRIRMVQESIGSCYLQDEMKTPVHLYIGQEAIASGVCGVLLKDDYISSNHRSHGHYLAKGGDLKALMAELYGRSDGCSKGYGGSMHLVDISVGHLGSSSIVGGCIPIGTGLGLAVRMKKTNQVSVIFFGDGAADEGVLYESINFAMLKKLPVIYILENNQWSVCSNVSARQADKNIFHQASKDLLLTRQIDGNDALTVYETACLAVDRAREGFGPSFIECLTYRIAPHAGCADQDMQGYRDSKEIDLWKSKCPVERFKGVLLKEAILSLQDIDSMEKRITDEIDAAFKFAKASPPANAVELDKFLFCD